MTLTLFRADKRILVPGDTIMTAGDFSKMHNEDGRLAEELLARTRPDDKPKRDACLMLFEEEQCARNYWANMSKGRLYQVTIDPQAIRHRGDMHLVNEIAAQLMAGGTADALAHAYWRGDMTATPCVEVLTTAGIVLTEFGSEAERIALFKQLRGIAEPAYESDDDFDERVFGIKRSRD